MIEQQQQSFPHLGALKRWADARAELLRVEEVLARLADQFAGESYCRFVLAQWIEAREALAGAETALRGACAGLREGE